MKNKIELNEDAIKIRNQMDLNNTDYIDLLNEILENLSEITIIFCPISEKTSGICINRNEIQIICINSAMNLGRQRFTLAHELYHLLIEKDFKFRVCNDNDSDETSEKEANIFASFLLMPEEALKNYIELNSITSWNLDEIIKIEQYFQMSHEAMLIRLKKFGCITEDELQIYKKVGITTAAKQRNIPIELYESPLKPEHSVFGKYINLIEELYSNNILSSGKKRELLLDAFRGDLVYNFDEDDDIFD